MGKTYNVRLTGVMLDGVMKDPETKLLTTHINNDNIHVNANEKAAIAAVSDLSTLVDSANQMIGQVNGAVAEEASARQAADTEINNALESKVDTDTFNAKASELEAADSTLQTAIDGKVSINGTDRLMTVLEGQKLEAYPAYSEVESAIEAKADSATVNEALSGIYTKAEAESMVDDKITAAVASVHSFKGQVANMVALEAVTGQVAGDIYNVVSTEKGTSAEYYWTGSAWEEFGTTIDMSGYATKEYADSKVAAEADRAQAAEEQNANAIGSESTVREEADTALDGKIDAEIATARDNESALSDRITANTSNITALTTSVNENITAERNRALAAESAVAENLSQEVSRASGAEATLTANVGALATQVGTITGAANVEGSIAYAVKAEADRAKGVEEGFDTDIEELGTAVENISNRLTTAESDIISKAATTDLTAEVTRATTAENELSVSVSANADAIAGLTNTVGSLDATIGSKVDAQAYNTKVSELESAIAGKASSADLTAAISGVYTKAETNTAISTAVSEAVASVYKFKGQVADLTELNAIEEKTIGDVYHVVSTDKGSSAEYFYTEGGWEELGTTISLSGYATTAALEAEATRAQGAEISISENVAGNTASISALTDRVATDEASISANATEIASLKSKKVESALINSTTGSRMLIFNEMDGGGSKVEHSVNTKGDRLFCTYVGLNDSGTLGMPSENDVLGQIYAINTATDPETGKKGFGLRLNFYKNRLCYFPAAFAGETTNDANRELAVKADIDSSVSEEADTRSSEIIRVENLISTEASAARAAESSNQSLSVVNYASLMNYINMLQSQIMSLKQATHTSLSGITAADDAVIDVASTVSAGDAVLDNKNAANITANSVQVKELSVDSVRLNISAVEDVTISNMNSTGSYPKANSNASNSINADGYVAIKESSIGQNGYNAIEIGSVKESKGIVIDGVEFTGSFSNNTISIFKNADNCVVTISNCHFVDCSNAIRISNVTGKKLILNVVNCTFDKWEGDNGGSKEYAGMIIFQDYTSTSAEATAENNLFGPDKVSVNIINCTHAGQKITWDNIADVCATNNDKQLFYAYGDKVGIIAYDANRYPKFTVQ